MLKKILIVFGGLFALLVLAAIIVPLVVDVDHYRSQIVQAANRKINGKLELGKLKLSLWGQIRVQAEGMKLSDAQGREVVGVQDAYFHLPFSSILSGSPVLTFNLQNPLVNVVKDKAGKMNVLALVKEDPSAAASAVGQPAGSAPQAPTGASGEMKLPGIAARALLGIRIHDARVTYKDELTGLTTEVNNLNLIVKDLSLTRPTELELWADLDTRMGKTLTLKGPARVTGRTQLELVSGKIDQFSLSLKAVADDVVISMPGTFEKPKGIAANIDLAIKTSAKELRIEKLEIKFHNAVLNALGTLTNTSGKLGSAPAPTEGVLKVDLHSNPIELKAWNELIPPLKQYELGGVATLNAAVEGPSDKIGYRADFAIKALTMKAPNLKAQPRFDAVVKVVTDQIENFSLTMAAPGNELRINGKMVSFTAPRLEANVLSNGMDLDQLIDFPPPGKKTAAAAPANTAKSGAAGSSAGTGQPATQDLDALLEPMRTNPMVANFVANVNVDLKMLKAYGVKMTDIHSKMTMRELTATIESLGMGIFGGKVSAQAAIAMKPKVPTYKFGTNVTGMDMQEAVSSQMALFKDTLIGKANFQMEGSGSSFNTEPAKKNLIAKGSLKVVDAKFATIDVGKMAVEAINKAMEGIQGKIPALKGKGLKALPSRDSRYEFVSSDFTLQNGKFSAPNFMTKAAPNSGIDLKGATTVGLVDLSLDTQWEIIDTFNLTKAKDISVDVGGVNVEHLLAEGNGPVRFPVSAGCTVTAPCYSYTQVPEFLAKVALANTQTAATGRLKSEAKKKIEEQLKNATKSAPPAIQNAIQGLGKKLNLFGH